MLKGPYAILRRDRELQEVIEVPFGADPAPDPENVRGNAAGIQRHEIAWPLPQEARARQQIVHLECAALRQTQGLQVELQPTCLGMMRIDIHDHEDRIAVLPGFAVRDQCVIVSAVKLQAAVAL